MKKDILKGKKGKWQDLPFGCIIDDSKTGLFVKTGNWRSDQKPYINEEKCIHCLICWINCPDNAIKTKNGKRKKIDLNYCKGCGICSEVCPVKAIKMIKEEK